ncbi:MAG: excinuclease ABC subunit UvrA [Fibrobacterota bacterium]|nr:excinuclease ABC subunit UvrA [Fibrobacterota bacterium]
MADNYIRVRGAKAHNLKNVNVDIPKDKLVVITGLSGSGKSSLAFDTIYAEGQRRYVESLSAYARQFLGLMEKPDVDLIEGLSPAISIDQKSSGHNPRSTVGTITEVYDYLRLLYARVGHARSPASGKRLKSQTVQEIVDAVLALPHRKPKDGKKLHGDVKPLPDEVKIMLLAPLVKDRKGTYEELFTRYLAQGYVRARVDGQVFQLEEKIKLDRYVKHNIELVVDRLVIKKDTRDNEEAKKRLTDSVELTLNLGEREMLVNLLDEKEDVFFSERLVDPATGKSFSEIEPHTFSFNSPHGACPTCNGLGFIKEVDPKGVFDMERSINDGGILPWHRFADNGDSWYMQLLRNVAKDEGFSMDKPLKDLSKKHIEILLSGTDSTYKVKYEPMGGGGTRTSWNAHFEGVIPSLKRKYEQTDSDFVRREIEEFMDDKPCATCKGLRLKQESMTVTIRGLNIMDLGEMSINDAFEWTRSLQEGMEAAEAADSTLYQFFKIPKIDPREDDLSENERSIAKQVFKEILARLTFLVSVGLNYLSLSRTARTLSGGESQRIRLASQIGTGLSGVLYVLDEPSIGLHQRDNDRLLKTLHRLRDLGNTVLVVEHDADTIRQADYVLDIGPGAGEHGGRVVFSGTPDQLIASGNTDTGAFLSGKRRIDIDEIMQEIRSLKVRFAPERSDKTIRISGVTHNNLKNVDVEIPLGRFVSVTGVSGSGKSSLINDVLSRVLSREIHGAKTRPGAYKSVKGLENIDKAIVIDQSPIGRTPRSNPATYTGLFTEIRTLFSMTQESKLRGYKPGRFSFNVKGGRCDNCEGDGLIRIEMQFLPDVYVTCEVCKGKRYNRDTLQIDYKGKNIAEVLDMTVEEGHAFFQNLPALANKLKTMLEVGLGYIRLGQSATTLSGGESQRMKLSAELSRRSTGRTFYILDEPSTGLHFEDVRKLLVVLHSLVAQGNTVLVIEHNLDIIKNSEYVVDMGPEGGEAGGRVIAKGTVAEVASTPGSYTGDWLRKLLESEKKWPPAKNAVPREFWPAVAPADSKPLVKGAQGKDPKGKDAGVKPPRGILAALTTAVSSVKPSAADRNAAKDVFGRKPGVTGEEAEAEVARKRGRPRKTIRV